MGMLIQVEQKLDFINNHNQSLFSIYQNLSPNYSLQSMSGWACKPDMLKYLMDTILDRKPKLILEVGSGISTIIMGYALSKNKYGKLISIEHDVSYVYKISDEINKHGLSSYVDIAHANIVDYNLGNKNWSWYDTKCLSLEKEIDILFIDGPPKNTGEFARYPAIPILEKYLSNESIIILDDGRRDDEKSIVDMWEKEFEGLKSQYLKVEKGAFLLTYDDKTE